MTSISNHTYELHRAFLEKRNESILLGCIHGWENLSKYVRHPESFMPKGPVSIEAITPDLLVPIYNNKELLINPDDLIRTMEPLTFFPWTEAALGCPVEYTGKNFWSSPIEQAKTIEGRVIWVNTLKQDTYRKQCQMWIDKYTEVVSGLVKHYEGKYPIGQPILRGPLDMAAATFGDEAMIYLFFDEPELMKEFLNLASNIFLRFVEIHTSLVPPYSEGSVLGSYYIWAPGRSMRLQEDAMALLSPDLYEEFGHPIDRKLASHADYTLFHLHATGLHLLDVLMKNDHLNIIQVSKDEGVELKPILSKLQRIQTSGKCLVIKGRFTNEEMHDLKACLDPKGLCIQGVVLDKAEANHFMEHFTDKR